jgi:hypothetical protein
MPSRRRQHLGIVAGTSVSRRYFALPLCKAELSQIHLPIAVTAGHPLNELRI